MLNIDPIKRIGVNDKSDIKKHAFFSGVDFNLVYKKKYIPPKVDDIKEEFDSTLPTEEVELKDKDYEEKNKTLNRVKNFTFYKENK